MDSHVSSAPFIPKTSRADSMRFCLAASLKEGIVKSNCILKSNSAPLPCKQKGDISAAPLWSKFPRCLPGTFSPYTLARFDLLICAHLCTFAPTFSVLGGFSPAFAYSYSSSGRFRTHSVRTSPVSVFMKVRGSRSSVAIIVSNKRLHRAKASSVSSPSIVSPSIAKIMYPDAGLSELLVRVYFALRLSAVLQSQSICRQVLCR